MLIGGRYRHVGLATISAICDGRTVYDEGDNDGDDPNFTLSAIAVPKSFTTPAVGVRETVTLARQVGDDSSPELEVTGAAWRYGG